MMEKDAKDKKMKLGMNGDPVAWIHPRQYGRILQDIWLNNFCCQQRCKHLFGYYCGTVCRCL